MKTSRFDYVKYDSISGVTQQQGKKLAEQMESFIESSITCQDAKAKALAKLEECYMWIGKGVRNDQITRNGGAELNELRDPSEGRSAIKAALMATKVSEPYAYTHKRTGKVSYKSHPHGGNAFIKRSPEKDKAVLQ